MLSFVHVGALVGLLAVALPVVIHLIKIHQRRQVIPSLLLFTSLKKTSRRHKLQNLLLLLSRILITIFLILLLARPFIEWSRNFFKAGDNQRVVFGIVLDDSLTAMVAVDGRILFNVARERIIEQMNKLSEDSAVLLATTSSGVCSNIMPLGQAKKVLKSLGVIPVNGDLGRAFDSLLKRMTGLKDYNFGGIMIAAAPVKSLWSSIDLKADFIPRKLVVLDFIDSGKLDPMINRMVKVDEPEPGYLLSLQGDPYGMTKGIIEIQNRGGHQLFSLRPDLKRAVQPTFFIPAEEVGDAHNLSAHFNLIGKKSKSPLSHFFYTPVKTKEKGKIFILYDNSKLSGIYAQIVFITLEAFLEDFREHIAFINCDEQAGILNNSLAPEAVFVTPLTSYKPVETWLVDMLNKGRRVICFPAIQAGLQLPGLPKELWPSWERTVRSAKEAPLTLINSSGLEKSYIRLYGKGLNHVRLTQIRPVKTLAGDKRIFSCNKNSILVSRMFSGGGTLFLWGVPLNKSAVPLLSNPLFPQLFKVLTGVDIEKNSASTLFQGTTIDVSKWLGLERGVGVCQLPNDERLKLNWAKGRPEMMYLAECGFYTFQVDVTQVAENEGKETSARMTSVKAVNYPRIPMQELNVKSFVQKEAAGYAVAGKQLHMEFRPIPNQQEQDNDKTRVIEDLTPVVVFVLLIVIALELLVLAYANWQGRRRIDI